MWSGEITEKQYEELCCLFCEKHKCSIVEVKEYRNILKKLLQLFWVTKVHTMGPLLYERGYPPPTQKWLANVLKVTEDGFIRVMEDQRIKPDMKDVILLFDSVSTYVLALYFKVCCVCTRISSESELVSSLYKRFCESYSQDMATLNDMNLSEAMNHVRGYQKYKETQYHFKGSSDKFLATAFLNSYYNFMVISSEPRDICDAFIEEMMEVKAEMKKSEQSDKCQKSLPFWNLDANEGDLREIANREYKKENYSVALKLYSIGISLSSHNYYWYGNRAQAYMKVGMYDEAEIDCRAAIIIRPEWSKAYYRLALALEGQNKIHDAHRVLSFGIANSNYLSVTLSEYGALQELFVKLKELCRKCHPPRHVFLSGVEDIPELETSESDNFSDVPELTDDSFSEEDNIPKDMPDLTDSSDPESSENEAQAAENSNTNAKMNQMNEFLMSVEEILSPTLCPDNVSRLLEHIERNFRSKTNGNEEREKYLISLKKLFAPDVKPDPCCYFTQHFLQTSRELSKNPEVREELQRTARRCKLPPMDTVCRYEYCPLQPVIFYPGLHMEGFTSIQCDKLCSLQYHASCWNALRKFFRREDNEFLDAACLSPNCDGIIVLFESFSEYGEVKRYVLVVFPTGDADALYPTEQIEIGTEETEDFEKNTSSSKESSTEISKVEKTKCAVSEEKRPVSKNHEIVKEKDKGSVSQNKQQLNAMPNKNKKTDVSKPKKKLSFSEQAEVEVDLKTALKEGSNAIRSNCPQLALQHFHQALSLIKMDPKKHKLKKPDVIALKYAYATACHHSGLYENICKAIATFKEIISVHSSKNFPAAHFGLALSHYKLNEFKMALTHLDDTLVKIKEVGDDNATYSWPGTSDVIKEINPEELKVTVNDLIDKCKCPPPPDAVCRYDHCSSNPAIYYSDPDFKGFISAKCRERCVLQYHTPCWKNVKESFGRNNKEFLDAQCLTPDCDGLITQIEIIGKQGALEKYFESEETKVKKCIKQKKSKLEKKFEIKEQRKRRRHRSRSLSESHDIAAVPPPPEDYSVATAETVTTSESKQESKVSGKEKPDFAEGAPTSDVKPSIPKIPPKNVPPAYVFKKDLEHRDWDTKIPKHKERKKPKKAPLSIDEFCGRSSARDISSYNEYQLRLHRLQESKRVNEETWSSKNGAKIPSAYKPSCNQSFGPVGSIKNKPTDLEPSCPSYSHDSKNEPDIVEACSLNADTATSESTLQMDCCSSGSDVNDKREEIYLKIENLLASKGGVLKLDDTCLLQEIESLSEEHKEIIESAGGFNTFIQNKNFAIVRESLCFFSQMCAVYNWKVNRHDSFDELYSSEMPAGDFEAAPTSTLSCSAADFSPLGQNTEDFTPAFHSEGYDDDDKESTALLQSSVVSAISKRRQTLLTYHESKKSQEVEKLDEEEMSADVICQDEETIACLISHLKTLLWPNPQPCRILECVCDLICSLGGTPGIVSGIMDCVNQANIERLDKCHQSGCPEVTMSSKGVMKEDDEFAKSLETIVNLKFKKAKLEGDIALLKEHLSVAISTISQLQRRISNEVPELKKRLQEVVQAQTNEQKLSNGRVTVLEKEVEQWQQKHEQLIETEKECRKECSKLQSKLNSLQSRLKDSVRKCEDYKEKLSGQSVIVEKCEKVVQENKILLERKAAEAADACDRAKRAEIELLNVRKTEFLKRLDLSIENAQQKLSELQDCIARSEAALQPYHVTTLNALVQKFNNHIEELRSIRGVVDTRVEEQISQLQNGKQLGDLKELELPKIPDIPTVHDLMAPNNIWTPPVSSSVTQPGSSYREQKPNFSAFPQQTVLPNVNFSAAANQNPGSSLFPNSQNLPNFQDYGALFAQLVYQSASMSGIDTSQLTRQNPNCAVFPTQCTSQGVNNSHHLSAIPKQRTVPPAVQSSESGSVENPNPLLPPGLMKKVASSASVPSSIDNCNQNVSSAAGAESLSARSVRRDRSESLSSQSRSPSVSSEKIEVCQDTDDESSIQSFQSLPTSLHAEKVDKPLSFSSQSRAQVTTGSSHNISGSSSSTHHAVKFGAVPLELGYTTDSENVAEFKVVEGSSQPSACDSATAQGSMVPSRKSSYARVLHKLKGKYPQMSESDLMVYVKRYRDQKTKFSGMTIDAIVSDVSTLIQRASKLKYLPQPQQTRPRVLVNKPLVPRPPSPPAPVSKPSVHSEHPWAIPAPNVPWSSDSSDRQCTICLEEMMTCNTMKVECGHTFHSKCIREWVDKSSNCPICRVHLLMPEDYPALS